MPADASCEAAGDTAIILVDIGARSRDSVAVVRVLHEAAPHTPILAMVERATERWILAALQAGAAGCLLLSELEQYLIPSIEQVVAGGVPLSPAVSKVILEHLRSSSSQRNHEPQTIRRRLSKREREILDELARGLTYDQIATAQGVSINTVRGFVRTLYRKLEVGSRTEAVVRASKLGWIRMPRPQNERTVQGVTGGTLRWAEPGRPGDIDDPCERPEGDAGT